MTRYWYIRHGTMGAVDALALGYDGAPGSRMRRYERRDVAVRHLASARVWYPGQVFRLVRVTVRRR